MCSRLIAGAFVLATIANAGVLPLWDNYPGGFDASQYVASERNTQIEDAWAVDDALLPANPALSIAGFEWIGLRDREAFGEPLSYEKAELTVLSPVLGEGGTIVDLTQVATRLVDYEAELLGAQGELDLYRGTIDFTALEQELVLDTTAGGVGEQVFFGVRLVEDVDDPLAGLGRNFWVSANGQQSSEAWFRSELFFQPDWTPVSDAGLGMTTPVDLAFRIIPEPATLSALFVAGLALAARRR